MIRKVNYNFDKFFISEKHNDLFLETASVDYDLNQRKLFSIMLNLGYIGFEPGVFTISAKEIVNFWEHAKNSVLNSYSLEEYYGILGFEMPYQDRIPSIKTDGSFHAKDFKMTVVWEKVDSNMKSTSIAYKQNGLRLLELDFNDTIGTLYPEYFELYYMIDKANSNWKDWSLKQKYDFLEELELHSQKRRIIIPKNLAELLNKHKNEE